MTTLLLLALLQTPADTVEIHANTCRVALGT